MFSVENITIYILSFFHRIFRAWKTHQNFTQDKNFRDADTRKFSLYFLYMKWEVFALLLSCMILYFKVLSKYNCDWYYPMIFYVIFSKTVIFNNAKP